MREAIARHTGKLCITFADGLVLQVTSTTGCAAWHCTMPRPGRPIGGLGPHIGITSDGGAFDLKRSWSRLGLFRPNYCWRGQAAQGRCWQVLKRQLNHLTELQIDSTRITDSGLVCLRGLVKNQGPIPNRQDSKTFDVGIDLGSPVSLEYSQRAIQVQRQD